MTVADLTRELVSIPSHDGEAAAGDFIETWLREETDAEVTRDDAGADEGRGGNVIARKGTGDTTLALVGHHDVVPPDESQVDADGGYVVEERDGRIYGRGTADMKGAVAAMMRAFRDADPAGELVFASFVGEESGGAGANAAVAAGFAPEHAVVCEGSTNYSKVGVTDVAVAHRGRRQSTIEARGSAAHASEPEAGENAIYRACDAVETVRNLDVPTTAVLGFSLEGALAVTRIDGGGAPNVIPERCSFTVDERTVPERRAALERVAELPGVSWSVDRDVPPMQCDDPAFADAVLASAREAQDAEPEHVLKPHTTDAGRLEAGGTTCVVCGPSEPGEAHTADESVSIAVLERCERCYRSIAESWPQ